MSAYVSPSAPEDGRDGIARLLDRLTPVVLAATLFAPAFIFPRHLDDPIRVMGELLVVAFAWLLIAVIGTARALRGQAVLGGGDRSVARWLLVGLGAWTALSVAWGLRPAAQWSYALTVLSYLFATQSVLGWLEDAPERRRLLLGLLTGLVAVEVAVCMAQMAKVHFFKLRSNVTPGGLADGWLAMVGSKARFGIPKGTLGNPNFVSELFTLLIPLMIGTALTTRKTLLRAVLGTLAVLALVAIIGAGTRAAIFGLAAGALLALVFTGSWRVLHPAVWWSEPKRRAAVLLSLVVVVGFGVAAGARLSGKLGRLAGEDSALSSRLDNWQAAVSVWTDRPLQGFGPGGWKIVGADRLAKLKPEGLSTPSSIGRFYQVHNEPLQGLVELGIIGLLLALGALGFWVREVARNESLAPAMRFGVIGGVLAILVTGCFGFPFHIPLTALAILLVVALGLAGATPPGAGQRLPAAWRWGYALAVLALSGVIGWLVVARGQMPVYEASFYQRLGEVSQRKSKTGLGVDVIFGLAARLDRYKPPHVVEQMEVLHREKRFADVLKVYDANAGEGLGMDALTIRSIALFNLGRKEEAIAGFRAVETYFGSKDRNDKVARKYLRQLGVTVPEPTAAPASPQPSEAPTAPAPSTGAAEPEESAEPKESDDPGDEKRGSKDEDASPDKP